MGDAEQTDRMRMVVTEFFRRLPEVPVYRRRDDPVRTVAAERAVEGRKLLEKTRSLGEAAGARALTAALEAHLEVLLLLEAGKVEAAEAPWHRALELERQAVSASRLWSRTDERPPPVYRRETGESRFDPRAEASVKVKLVCPASDCRKVDNFDFSARHATHQFVCPHCQTRFTAYFAEVLELRVEARGKHEHRYHFRVRQLDGDVTRVDFDDGGEAELAAAQGDLLAFLYSPRTRLRAVLDLSSSRVLWVRPSGPCFLATEVFGEGAPELDAFRNFRDQVLLRSRAGGWLVARYYAAGPRLAALVATRPALRRLTRQALTGIHRILP